MSNNVTLDQYKNTEIEKGFKERADFEKARKKKVMMTDCVKERMDEGMDEEEARAMCEEEE